MARNQRALHITDAVAAELRSAAEQLGQPPPATRDDLVSLAMRTSVDSGLRSVDDVRSAVAAAGYRRKISPEGRIDDGVAAALVIALSDQPRCGVGADATAGMRLLQYSGTSDPFANGGLSWSLNTRGAVIAMAQRPNDSVRKAVTRAFELWASVLPTFFSFREVASGADITINFRLDPTTVGPRVVGLGTPPSRYQPNGGRQTGRVRLRADPAPPGSPSAPGDGWDLTYLAKLVTHELGHVLGLQHSTLADSIMLPVVRADDGWDYEPIDDESRHVLRDLYDWETLSFRDSRASAYPPAMAQTGRPNTPRVHMVWSGRTNDARLSYSVSTDKGHTWTIAREMSWPAGATPVYGPALTSYRTPGRVNDNRLFMAWAGEREQLWFVPRFDDPGNLQAAPVPGHTSDRRPALTSVGDTIHMAWKSNGDQRVWWATYAGGGWSVAHVIPHLITDHAPALGAIGDRVLIVVRNPNKSLVVCELLPSGRWTQPSALAHFDFEASQRPGAQATDTVSTNKYSRTDHAPSLARARSGREIVLAYPNAGDQQMMSLRIGRYVNGAAPIWRYRANGAASVTGAGHGLVVVWVDANETLLGAVRDEFAVVGLYDGDRAVDARWDLAWIFGAAGGGP